MTIRAVLFDMDGTLYDSGIDWRALRAEIDIPWDGRPILEQLADANGEARERGLVALHEAEAIGASAGRLIEGAEELLGLLRARGILCALITNNSRRSADTVLSRHALRFDLVLTRDDGVAKPAPHLFIEALDRLGVTASEALVVGDAHLDLIAAKAAGIHEVILVGTPEWMREHIPDGATYLEARDLFHVAELVKDRLRSGAS
jgi:HAD superfamily hydrolase (TIGR01509 family)